MTDLVGKKFTFSSEAEGVEDLCFIISGIRFDAENVSTQGRPFLAVSGIIMKDDEADPNLYSSASKEEVSAVADCIRAGRRFLDMGGDESDGKKD